MAPLVAPHVPRGSALELKWDDIVAATDGFSERNLLGDGAFGPVYSGKLFNKKRGTPVAVKRMRLKATPRYGISTLQSAAEYEQEAAVLSRLRHPNVVTFIGGAIGPDGERALVYELMDAGTVDDRLFPRRDGPKLPPLHWRVRLSVLRQLARALMYLHSLSPPVVRTCRHQLRGADRTPPLARSVPCANARAFAPALPARCSIAARCA